MHRARTALFSRSTRRSAWVLVSLPSFFVRRFLVFLRCRRLPVVRSTGSATTGSATTGSAVAASDLRRCLRGCLARPWHALAAFFSCRRSARDGLAGASSSGSSRRLRRRDIAGVVHVVGQRRRRRSRRSSGCRGRRAQQPPHRRTARAARAARQDRASPSTLGSDRSTASSSGAECRPMDESVSKSRAKIRTSQRLSSTGGQTAVAAEPACRAPARRPDGRLRELRRRQRARSGSPSRATPAARSTRR